MNVRVTITETIDTDLLTKQRALIGTLIGSLDDGRLGHCIKRDRNTLLGIQGILDAIADSVPPDDSFSHLDDYDQLGCPIFTDIDEGPECPGCTHPGDCEDCEYQYDNGL